MNCRGLGHFKKRRDVFNYLREKKFSIICLQDTHFEKKSEKQILAEWGYKAWFSSGTSNSRGVTILFTNNFEFKVHNCKYDPGGNFLILDVTIDDKRITLVNLYAPNKDSPDFFNDLKQNIIQQGNTNIIIVGDWNLLLDPKFDGYNYKHVNNPNARFKVEQLMFELNLIDVWRDENPEARKFTWTKKQDKKIIQMGRLDYFLISNTLIPFTNECKILPGYRTDHSLITTVLKFTKQTKPNPFWKFNNSLLKDVSFISEIKSTILETKKYYAASPYNQENIGLIENKDLILSINPQLFFEMLLLNIRSKSISFAAAKKKEQISLINTLQNEIADMENLDQMGLSEKIEEQKEKLREIREQNLEGTLVRAKARWIEEGEKPTKYFCNMENRHYTSKFMKSLTTKDNKQINETKDILNEVKSFYEDLYTSRDKNLSHVNLNKRLKDNTPKLSNDQSLKLEGKLSLKEAGESLYKMNNFRSPGSDGFTVEFYKFFWIDIGQFLVNSINYSYDIGVLSTTQQEGIITCIPKSNKPKEFIKNWRPITLLNVAYKIASSCIATRIKNILPELIGVDQCGFMSGRFTGDIVRLVFDILSYAKVNNKGGIILLIDFEKAFDSISWSFLHNTLKYFNFGDNVCSWISLFLNNIKSRVYINGQPSSWFEIGRGCRQGDPISPYLFLICCEVLAHMIRQNDKIKGFQFNEEEVKLGQFADDTNLFLDGSKDSFQYCIETILEYAKYSGLNMNSEKTKVIRFGRNLDINKFEIQGMNGTQIRLEYWALILRLILKI